MNTQTEINTFCENVKRLRKYSRLSKEEMAKILGIGVASLGKIENVTLPPKLNCEVLFRIQAVFHIPVRMMLSKILESKDISYPRVNR